MTIARGPLLDHPGPAPGARLDAHACVVRRAAFELPRGAPLLDALASELADAEVTAGVGRLSGGGFRTLAYANPAHSHDRSRAVTFSEPIVAAPPAALEIGNLTLGMVDDTPFVHCHAIFTDGHGRRLGGHVIPDDAVVEDAIEVSIEVFEELTIEMRPDDETGFTLFQPRATPARRASAGPTDPEGAPRGVFARVRPHEDLVGAIEELAVAHELSHARVQGIGSIVGATFAVTEGGRRQIGGPALEVLDLDGEVVVLDDAVRAEVELTGVDVQRELSSGTPMRGENPVAVTYELALLPP